MTQSGGTAKYFGRADGPEALSEEAATQRFTDWLRVDGEAVSAAKIPCIRLSELVAKFCAWLEENRSKRTAGERRKHLRRFLRTHGDRWCHSLRLHDLEEFLAGFSDLLYRRHHAVSVGAMIRWGRNHNLLSRDFDPYAGLSLPATPPKHLSEASLPTDEEILALLKHAGPDLSDLIRFYLAVGCRTSEALRATVGSFNARSKTIILADHKTATKTNRTRQIVLNETAYEIVTRRSRSKGADDRIFTKRDGRPWRMNNLSHHWQALRGKAEVRETVTPYSLRHLWASDAIESGLDLSTVAKMMGSSTAVVERYYAHFRTSRLQEAHQTIGTHRNKRGLAL